MYNSLTTNFVTKKDWIMRSTFKVLFYVNARKEKNGIVPIMGRVTIIGSVAQFSCKRTTVSYTHLDVYKRQGGGVVDLADRSRELQ